MCARNVQHRRANLANRMRVTQRLLFGRFQDDRLACCPHEQHGGRPLGTPQVHIPLDERLPPVGNTVSHAHLGRSLGTDCHQNPSPSATPLISMIRLDVPVDCWMTPKWCGPCRIGPVSAGNTVPPLTPCHTPKSPKDSKCGTCHLSRAGNKDGLIHE